MLVLVKNTFIEVMLSEDALCEPRTAHRSLSIGSPHRSKSEQQLTTKTWAFDENETSEDMGIPFEKQVEERQHGKKQSGAKPFTDNDDTTLVVLRNIPYQYSWNELTSEFSKLGVGDLYEDVHLPMNRRGDLNLGCAFVNLKAPGLFDDFKQALHGYKFLKQKHGFSKGVTVKRSDTQGIKPRKAVTNSHSISASPCTESKTYLTE